MRAISDSEKLEKILSQLKKTKSGCLEWHGAKGQGYKAKYVTAQHNNVQWRGHRLVWALTNGPIPRSAVVCHKCDNPRCLNVEHLFLGTTADNNYDKIAKGRSHIRKKPTHCPHGHLLAGDNLLITLVRGYFVRECMECKRTSDKKRRKKLG